VSVFLGHSVHQTPPRYRNATRGIVG